MKKNLLFTLLLILAPALRAEDIEPVQPPLPTPLNVAIGAATSIIEKPIGQPLGFIQSRVIQNKSIHKPIDKNGNRIPFLHQLARYYRGLPTSMVCGGISTGVEIASKEKFLSLCSPDKKPTDSQKLLAAGAAGVVSAHMDAPVETVTLHQQNKGKDLAHTIETIRNVKPFTSTGSNPMQGLCNFYRGYPSIVMRNAISACGNWALYEQLRKKGSQYITHDKLNNVLTATATGICTATLTHPFTFAKTRLQGDLEKAKYKNAFDVLKKAVRTEGVFSIFKGYVPRTVRSIFATGIMFNAQAKLKEFMGHNYHARKVTPHIQHVQPRITSPLDSTDIRCAMMNGG